MWRPRSITLEVGRHVYRLRHTPTGWQPIDEPLPDGLWGQVEPKVARAIRGWRALQIMWLFIIASQFWTMSFLRSQPPAGATTGSTYSLFDWLSLLAPLGFLAIAIQFALGPLHIWHYSKTITHRPRCRKCSYSLHGLDLDDTQSLICPSVAARTEDKARSSNPTRKAPLGAL